MSTPVETRVDQLNEFLSTVVNKIGRQEWSSKAYSNPLGKFKKGFIEHANEIEEIYVQRVAGLTQDKTGETTLKRVKPTVKALYHTQNFGKCYTATISDKQVRQAFQSQEGVKKLSDEILTQQHNGVEYDEYIEMKKAIEAFAKAVPGTAKRTITDVTDSATAKDLVKAIKKDIAKMQFRSTNYCKFEQHTRAEDIVLFLHVDYQAEIGSRVVFVDGFTDPKLKAVVMDYNAIKVYDTLYSNEPQRNAQGMYTNYHLNVEKIISYSTLFNGASYSTAE